MFEQKKTLSKKAVKVSWKARLIYRLQMLSGSRWFLPGVSIFPMLDFALLFIPNQILLLTLSALNPHYWKKIAVVFVGASGVGAFFLATFIASFSFELVKSYIAVEDDSEQWSQLIEWISRYGVAALLILSLLPWTPRSAVIVSAAAGIEPLAIGVTVTIGRTAPIFFYASVGSRIHSSASRWRRVRVLLGEIKKLSEAKQISDKKPIPQ